MITTKQEIMFYTARPEVRKQTTADKVWNWFGAFTAIAMVGLLEGAIILAHYPA